MSDPDPETLLKLLEEIKGELGRIKGLIFALMKRQGGK